MSSHKLPNYLEINNPDFSESASSDVNLVFPKNNTPYSNLEAEVTLHIANAPRHIGKVHISTTKDLEKTVVDSACFVADMWIDGELEESDDISIIDLLGATVHITNPENNKTLKLAIELDLRSKAKKVNS